jgi:hypothetical protein
MPVSNLLRKTCIAAAAVAALSAPLLKSALPQPVPLPVPTPINPIWPGVPPDDVERMHSAAARLYESRSIGTIERWRNPDTKDAGEVQLIRSFLAKGMPCRTISYTIRYASSPNRLDRHLVDWCHVHEDGWQIVNLPRQP